MELLAPVEPVARGDHLIQHRSFEGGHVHWTLYGKFRCTLRDLHARANNFFWKPRRRLSVPSRDHVVSGWSSTSIIGHYRGVYRPYLQRNKTTSAVLSRCATA